MNVLLGATFASAIADMLMDAAAVLGGQETLRLLAQPLLQVSTVLLFSSWSGSWLWIMWLVLGALLLWCGSMPVGYLLWRWSPVSFCDLICWQQSSAEQECLFWPQSLELIPWCINSLCQVVELEVHGIGAQQRPPSTASVQLQKQFLLLKMYCCLR